MSTEATETLHLDLKTAQKAAEEIERGNFRDSGANAADEVVQQITADLSNHREGVKQMAAQRIKQIEKTWMETSGRKEASGTAGAILTRLLARGIINELPQGTISVQEILPYADFLLTDLRSKITGEAYDDLEKDSKAFLTDADKHAFAAVYAGEYSGFATVEKSSPPPIDILQTTLKNYAHAQIGVSPLTQGKGIEKPLIESVEAWARNQQNRGLWMEYRTDDKANSISIKSWDIKLSGYLPLKMVTAERLLRKTFLPRCN